MVENVLLILLVAAIGAEAFSGLFINGFVKEAVPKKQLLIAVICTAIGAGMFLLGMLIGTQVNHLLEGFSRLLSGIIFFVVGLKIGLASFRPKFQQMLYELNKPGVLAGFSVAVGMNVFLAGIALPAFGFPFANLMIIFLMVYFIITLTAVLTGKTSKNFLLAARYELSASALLVIGSIIMMLNLFGVV